MLKKSLKSIALFFFILLGSSFIASAPVGAAAKNGWVLSNNTWYYYENGVMVKNGWKLDFHGWCFLNAVDGSWVQEGWAKDSHGWGYIQNGYWVDHEIWARDNSGWVYVQPNGYWDGKPGQAQPGTIQVKSITINTASAEMETGKTLKLMAAVLPVYSTERTITWTSSNEAIAKVDSQGNVTGVSSGTAVITAEAGGLKADCTINVTSSDWFVPGTYKIGTDIPAGEYLVLGAGYGELRNSDNIITNDLYLSSWYITAGDGEYLEFTDGRAYTIDKAPAIDKSSGILANGMFKVGRDLPAGEYRISGNSSFSYYEVDTDNRGTEIVDNDIFTGTAYVTVKDGEYLELVDCSISLN